MKPLWKPLWTLDEALTLVRQLESPLRSAGFGLALGGSVLFKGESRRDLDLVIFPLDATKYDQYDARTALFNAGLRLWVTRWEVAKEWDKLGSTDNKHVEVWRTAQKTTKRIDIFWLT